METKLVCYICLLIVAVCLWISCRKGKVIEGFSGGKTTKGGTCGGACASAGSGSGGGGGGKGGGLLPIMDVKFNLREICKNCILLEDHLISPRKRCDDCIRKHFLTIEGLGDEAKTLDKPGQYKKELETVSATVYKLQKDYLAGRDLRQVGQDLRKVRKQLVPMCYDEVRKF